MILSVSFVYAYANVICIWLCQFHLCIIFALFIVAFVQLIPVKLTDYGTEVTFDTTCLQL